MIKDKDMANDALESAKIRAEELTRAAAECSNKDLKGQLLKMRNHTEQVQEQISDLTTQNNWYLEASPADQQEVNRVKSFYQQAQTTMQQQ